MFWRLISLAVLATLLCGFACDSGAVTKLAITTLSVPAAIQKKPYSFTLKATGGTPPYKWSKISGTLPIGISLTTQGILSGTTSSLGSFKFTVRVTDSARHTVEETLQP